MGRANTNILRKQTKIKYLYIHNTASQISHGSKVGTFIYTIQLVKYSMVLRWEPLYTQYS